jgi:hypothetical protein
MARSTAPQARRGWLDGCREPSWLTPAKSWGSGSLLKRVVIGPCPLNRLGQTAGAFEDSIDMSSPDVKHQLSAWSGPSHLALLVHALIDQLVHRRLDVGGCDPFALAASPSVVGQRANVRIEIAFEFVEALASGFNFGKIASRVNLIAMRKQLRAQSRQRYDPSRMA